MSRFTKQSIYLKATMCTLIMGFITHIVSFVSPYWLIDGEGSNIGLWLNCVETSCESLTSPPDWLRSSQVLEVIGVVTGLTSLIVLLVTFFTQKYKEQRSKARHIAMIILSFMTAVFLQITVAVVIKSNFTAGGASLSWALSVNILAVVFYGATGIVLIIDALHLIFYGDAAKPSTDQRQAIG